MASRTSGASRDSSTPKAFGTRNDKERNARTGESKRRNRRKSRIRKTNVPVSQVVSTPGLR
jgi:hypothetical protein